MYNTLKKKWCEHKKRLSWKRVNTFFYILFLLLSAFISSNSFSMRSSKKKYFCVQKKIKFHFSNKFFSCNWFKSVLASCLKLLNLCICTCTSSLCKKRWTMVVWLLIICHFLKPIITFLFSPCYFLASRSWIIGVEWIARDLARFLLAWND